MSLFRPYEIAVIGGGPAGLSAGIVLSRCNRRVVLIDAGHGRNQSTSHVNNYLGANGVSPGELRNRGAAAFTAFGGTLLSSCLVTCVQPAGSRFVLLTPRGPINTTAVILATGQRDRLPTVRGLEQFYGTQVHHCPYCDAMMYLNKRVAVIGADEAAYSMALNLLTWTPHVTLLLGDQQTDGPDLDQLHSKGVRIVRGRIQACVSERGCPARLTGLQMEKSPDINVDAIFFPSQAQYSSTLHEDLRCRLNESGQIDVDAHQRSSTRGVYVAGDATGVGSLAIIAAAEGARAAMTAHEDLLLTSHSGET